MRASFINARLIAALGLVTAVVAGLAIAQQQVQFGTALDASLQLGSGGYNQSKLASPMASQRYIPGMSKPLYVPSNAGGFKYSTHNAFNPQSGYTSRGYHSNYASARAPVGMSPIRYR